MIKVHKQAQIHGINFQKIIEQEYMYIIKEDGTIEFVEINVFKIAIKIQIPI